MKESKVWQEIEKDKARQRQSGGQGGILLLDNCPEANKGAVRDIIAEKVGLGSGRSYERAVPAVKKIKNLNSTKSLCLIHSVDEPIWIDKGIQGNKREFEPLQKY